MQTSLQLLLAGMLAWSGQAPATDAAAPAPADVEVLGFRFATATRQRAEVREVNLDPGRVPTGSFPVRAEFGREPVRGKQYVVLESHGERATYATVTLSNTGRRAIKSVEWEYVLPHFVKGREVTSYFVRSKAKIPPCSSAVLSSELPLGDCGTVHMFVRGEEWVQQNCGPRDNRRMTGIYRVEARVTRIVYDNGSIWRRP